VLPVDVDVQAVQPHAHYRAREVRGDAVRPDGLIVPLIWIRRWDFRWQHVYRYETPVSLPKGTRLTMTFMFDNSSANSANPASPPVLARWGQRTDEEMCDLWVQVLTENEHDLRVLNKDFRIKAVHDDLVGYEQLITRTPDDVGLRDDAAVLSLEAGDVERAVTHWRRVVELQPSAAAHYNLGTALGLVGQSVDAIREFRAALQLYPSHAPAHHRLALELLARGERDRALEELRAAVRSAPQWMPALVDLSWMLATTTSPSVGDRAEALTFAERAVMLSARQDPAVLDVFAVALAADGQFARAIAIVDEALALVSRGPLADDIRRHRDLFLKKHAYQR
jgi:tetratricopeptide (TPR) repeat protein